MSSPKSKKSKHADQKTKGQLLKALSEAHALLEEQEKEMSSCKNELQKTKAELNKMTGLQNELEQTKAELEAIGESSKEVSEKAEHIKEIEQEIIQLRSENDRYREENETLLSQLQATDTDNEEQSEEIKSLQEELEKVEAQSETQQKKIQELEKMNADLQDQLSARSETAMTPIPENTGAEESSYQPEQQEEPESPESTAPVPMIERKAEVPVELSPGKLVVVPRSGASPGNLSESDRPFQVQVACSFKDKLKEEINLKYKVSLYGKRLGGGKQEILGEITGESCSSENFSINADIPSLPKGIYRLEAVGAFESTEGEPIPMAVFQESSIINIY